MESEPRRFRAALYEGQFFVWYFVGDQLLMPSSYHAGFKQGIPQAICATKPSSLIEQCKVNSVNGLPPGLALSAELSEFYMQDFDQRVREQLNAHYFARYVDDIVLILPELDNPNSLKVQIEEALPAGLKLNFSKSKTYVFGNMKKKPTSVEHSFDYLGFKFNVYETDKDRPFSRRVDLDIASSKVKKNKTRIVKSLLQYLADGNFDDLIDRVRVLTCGYQFFDERQQKKRSAGLQHTYSLIESNAPALAELDRFFSGMVLRRSGAIGGGWRSLLLIVKEKSF